jgi:hypothetical protein
VRQRLSSGWKRGGRHVLTLLDAAPARP